MNFIPSLFSSDGFMPHGHCYAWDPWLVWLHVVSDSLISLAYLTIPLTLIFIARKRKDLPFEWMFACFGVFILACGATHALEVWTLWTPTYWLSGMMKAITAAASVATAILLVKLIPRLLAIPSSSILREANSALLEEAAERRHAEAELRTANEKLQTIFDSAPLAIVSGDLEGRITSWSAGAERMFGWTAAEAIGRVCPTIPQDGLEDFKAMIDRVRNEGSQTGMVDGRQKKSSERIVVSSSAAPLRDGAGRTVGVMVVHEDISERAAAHEALRKAHAELTATNEKLLVEARERRQAEQALREGEETLHEAKKAAERANAAKGEFLSRMSHELRTPLNSILGFGQLLEMEERAPEEADNVAQILKAGRHLLGLVNEVLDVSRLEAREGSDFWIGGPLAERPVAQPDQSAHPANPRPESAATSAARPGSPIPSSGTLLHIEGNASDLRLVTRILARRPAIHLLSAATGARGLEMAREHRPDLILLDLHLPDIHGDQVLAQLRTDPRTSEIPVVMLSAGDLPAKREQMLAAGACAFFMKPVEVRTLLGVLDTFIEFTPEGAGKRRPPEHR